MDFNKLTSATLSSTLSSTLSLFQQHRTLITSAAVCVAAGISLSVLSDIIEDYREWQDLGPNGMPFNIFGYLVQAVARPFARSDTREAAPFDQDKLSKLYGPIVLDSFLTRPPSPRSGERPVVPKFVGPHRQTSQEADGDMRSKQEAFLHELTAANPKLFQVKPSGLEGPLFNAIWLADGITMRDEMKHLKGEFAHAHAEGSTHLILSLVDAAKAIGSGWGERHRLSGVGFLIPWGFVMIYAPRDEKELQVWKEFIVASGRYVLGHETEVVMPSSSSSKKSRS
ncbi:hypothetical protein F4781DRAFT_174584 [Annulohypoxylon bovei var. microspora]|nr:hypothetical protein F4781DRAFT_174584 [Annulohypoxylon bovei var. microspora]